MYGSHVVILQYVKNYYKLAWERESHNCKDFAENKFLITSTYVSTFAAWN